MKSIITIVALFTFLLAGMERPEEAKADTGGVILAAALIGAAAFGGYYFSETYEIKRRAAVETNGMEMALQQQDLPLETAPTSLSTEKEKRFTLALVTLNF